MTDAEWRGLCTALARPEWLQDPRFATPAGRQEHIEARLAMTQQSLLDRPAAEWLEIFARHDVPAAPALTRNELIEHPQIRASELLMETEHPVGGRIRQARVAARFEGTPVQEPPGAPALGEHTDAILAEIGCTPAQIDDLRARGAIGPQRTPRPAPEPIDIEQELEALVSRTSDSTYGVN
jgi:crotonobetainyl-CoA:carnitine CoA-transferase CaiB-like acyl-CoA transferase